MPASRTVTDSARAAPYASEERRIVVLSYGDVKIGIKRPATLHDLLKQLSKLFGAGVDDDFEWFVSADVDDELKDVRVGEDAWDTNWLKNDKRLLIVHKKKATVKPVSNLSKHEIYGGDIVVKTMSGKMLKIHYEPFDTVEHLQLEVEELTGIPPRQQRLIYQGRPLVYGRALADYNICDGSVIPLFIPLRGGKPVIYLLPSSSSPLSPKVDVALTLSSEWRFSALYPVVDPKLHADGSNTAKWTVSASQDSKLVDLETGLSLSYLYWEAETQHAPALTPPDADTTATLSSDDFSPNATKITSSNSLVLPLKALVAHLDSALKSLSLNSAARNDFITFWLPSFAEIAQQGKQIASRFVDQESYSRHAILDVSPKPDVVTRIFLVFKSVTEQKASEWSKADISWTKAVKLDPEAFNEDKFRVLEWGGMKVV